MYHDKVSPEEKNSLKETIILFSMGENRTDSLFATPTLLMGASTVFAVGGFMPRFNSSLTANDADTKAVSSDWMCIGQDIRQAIETIDPEINVESQHSQA
jgi:hypothetical protein